MLEHFNSPWAFATLFLLVGGVLIAIKLGATVKISKDGISAQGKNAKPTSEPLIPSKFLKYTLILIDGAVEHTQALERIRRETTRRSMKTVEEDMLYAVSIMKATFAKLTKESGASDEECRKERAHYNEMVCAAYRVGANNVRTWVSENHFYKKNESEWRIYKQEKTQAYLNVLNNYVDEEWYSTIIPRDVLHRIYTENLASFFALASATFDKLREVSIKANQEVECEQEKYYDLVFRVTGHDPYSKGLE